MSRAGGVSWLLWRRFAWRHWRRDWRQTVLLLLLLAVGVGSYLSIQMANRAAIANFGSFTESISGTSDWVIVPLAGGLDDSLLPDLQEAVADLAVELAPVAESTGALPRQPGDPNYGRRTFQLTGLDLVAIQNLPEVYESDNRLLFGDDADDNETADGREWWEVLADLRSSWIAPGMAADFELSEGDTYALLINENLVELSVTGILPAAQPDDPPELRPPDNLVILDIAALQQHSGRPGKVDRIEVLVTGERLLVERRAQTRERLAALAQGRFEVIAPEADRAAGATMTAAFRLNLLVLSLIALAVAAYLILQALDAAVVRRRGEIGTLRSLGVTRAEFLRGWAIELTLFGLIGSALGLVLGSALAQLSVRAVSRTVNALYQSSAVDAAWLSPVDAGFALLLGLGCTYIGGLLPALDAIRTPPAQVLQRGDWSAGLPALHWRWGGWLFLGLGLLLSQLPAIELTGGTRFPLGGYLAAFAWIVGGTLLAGRLIRPLGWLLKRCSPDCAIRTVAGSRLQRGSSRHTLAVAGLYISVGMAAGMSLLVGSFEHTVSEWVKQRFQADVFIAADGAQSASARHRIEPDTWQAIVRAPEVHAYDLTAIHPIRLQGKRTQVQGQRIELIGQRVDLSWVAAPQDSLTQASGADAGGIVSEAFTERFAVGVGDLIDIPTPTGVRTVRINGVYADYGSERGSLTLDLPVVQRWFDDERLVNVQLFLDANADAHAYAQALAAANPGLSVRTNASLREVILEIFRQTFAVTQGLKLIALAVALAGLGLGLITLLREARNSLRTLRELGLSRAQMAAVTAWEGLGLSASGLLAGLVLGGGLGWLLIRVINKQSFGWTLQLALPLTELLILASATLLTGGLLAWWIGRWAARLPFEQDE
ncbi:MAG: FtsX-like permease family protein [Opitutales bacterium]